MINKHLTFMNISLSSNNCTFKQFLNIKLQSLLEVCYPNYVHNVRITERYQRSCKKQYIEE